MHDKKDLLFGGDKNTMTKSTEGRESSVWLLAPEGQKTIMVTRRDGSKRQAWLLHEEANSFTSLAASTEHRSKLEVDPCF